MIIKVTLNTIISAHANANDKDGAIMFLNIMKNELHLIPDEITLAIITRIFNKLGNKDCENDNNLIQQMKDELHIKT